MTRFILHIGYGKTGTTALQSFLKTNRSALAEHGILYPNFCHWGVPLENTDHNMVGAALAGQLGWLKLKVEKYFSQINKQILKQPHIHTVLMSGETFLGMPEPHYFSEEADYWAANEQKLAKLRDLLRGRPTTIVLYVRRQDEWLEASLNQTIKFEGLSKHPPDTSIEGYMREFAPRLDYYHQVSIWAKYFGHDALRVGLYDRSLLKNGDIVNDFIERAGLPMAVSYRRPATDPAAANDRLCRDVLEVKRILNRIPRKKEEERALAQDLRAISGEMNVFSTLQDPPLFSRQQRQELLMRYAGSNERLVKDFMFGSSAAFAALCQPRILLNDGENPEGLYQGLNIYSTIEILHRLEERHIGFIGTEQWLKLTSILRRHFPIVHAVLRLFRYHIKYKYRSQQ